MESDSKLGSMISQASDWLNEQEWFQDLKGKWDALDPQSQLYVKVGALIAPVLLVLVFVLSMMWSVHGLKKELSDKNDLLGTIQVANDEMRRLKDVAASSTQRAAPSGDQGGPWPAYFETVAGAAGVDKGNLSVSPGKPGVTNDLAKESLYDVSLKHVNIKQVTRLAFGLENGARPVKLRNLTIDTKNDPSGYMDATLSVSAFTLQTQSQ